MKKDCINDFIAAWRKYDGDHPYKFSPWDVRFRDAGYYSADLNLDSGGPAWNIIHLWCLEQFGEQHYTWVGNKFWFECKEDVTLFKLKWQCK